MAPKGAVAEALTTLGARSWQIEIAAPILESALLETEPLAEPVADGEEAAAEAL
jgi:ribonuclease D